MPTTKDRLYGYWEKVRRNLSFDPMDTFVDSRRGRWTGAEVANMTFGDDTFERITFDEEELPYHNNAHTLAVLEAIDERRGELSLKELGTCRLAAFWHDYGYKPGDDQNEANAVLEMWDVMDLLHPERLRQAARAILATRPKLRQPIGPIGHVLRDADQAVLAGTYTEYLAYATRIRAEYPNLSPEAWKRGRSEFIRQMLAQDRIYLLEGTEGHEKIARRNLMWELGKLNGGHDTNLPLPGSLPVLPQSIFNMEK